MNRRIKKSWELYLATPSFSNFCRWMHYAFERADRLGEIEKLAKELYAI